MVVAVVEGVVVEGAVETVEVGVVGRQPGFLHRRPKPSRELQNTIGPRPI